MNIIIANSSPDPIYEQIYKQIKQQIMKGDLQPGEALPSIRVLAKELQISVITTKRAYEELERDGFIATVSGKGSFVAEQNLELLKERKRQFIEDKMAEIVTDAKMLNISLEEMVQMLTILYGEV
ncbi:MAG: GntR family transcriptional regulator [Syntrophomonadaceae bacterium]